jgi:hypothetical protein
MKFPVKFNRAFWPGFLTQFLPSADDPRPLALGSADETDFSKMVSTFKFGSTFKSTRPSRFPMTLAQLASIPNAFPLTILDIAASDGVTSLDMMRTLLYKKYFVTDLNLEVLFSESSGTTYFYTNQGNCILAVNDPWIIYSDEKNALFPFKQIATSKIKSAPEFQKGFTKITLISPQLLAPGRERVEIKQYDIFQKWPFEKADLILAANILNREYFKEEAILTAFGNLLEALEEGGWVVVVDNRRIERATIFQLIDGCLAVKTRVNGGTRIEAILMDQFGGSRLPILDPLQKGNSG